MLALNLRYIIVKQGFNGLELYEDRLETNGKKIFHQSLETNEMKLFLPMSLAEMLTLAMDEPECGDDHRDLELDISL